MPTNELEVKSVFDEALEITSQNERREWLDERCAGCPDLRRDVDNLLKAYDAAGSFLRDPVLETMIYENPEDLVGHAIGPYKLREQIGKGGMGLVYVAEQTEPVRRKVALKLIKPGLDSADVLKRFAAERQALAMMDHPNIARVFDAGTTEAGRPFFVMELVRGKPITEYCDEQRLTTRQRLKLFTAVCRAVQHAHLKGVIHRDIKPSNVLVTITDGLPVPKVIDFGLAKAVHHSLSEGTVYTRYAQFLGTPAYMSPEQAEMTSHDIDTRSDVYSLGVLLYELLTGDTPFDKTSLKEAGFDEMRRMIREDDPPRPSARLSTLNDEARSTVAGRRGSDPRKYGRQLRGELDWIVMKALEKDRNRRYESASTLIEDVQRFVRDEPVTACPPSVWYRTRKFSRRRKGLLTATCLVSFSVVAATCISIWQAHRATNQAARAIDAEQVSNENLQIAKGQQRRAETNYALLRTSLDEFYLYLIEERLPREPALSEINRALLQKTLNFYIKIATLSHNEPAAREEAAGAFLRISNLQLRLGNNKESRDAARRSLQLYKELQRDDPDDANLLFRMSASLRALGIAERKLCHFEQAAQRLDQAAVLSTRLLKTDPTNRLYRYDYADNIGQRSVILAHLGKRDAADDILKQGLAIVKSLVHDYPLNR